MEHSPAGPPKGTTPWFQTSGLQNCERIHLCCFKLLNGGNFFFFLPLSQETTTGTCHLLVLEMSSRHVSTELGERPRESRTYKRQLMPQTESSQAGCRLRYKGAWTEPSGGPTSEVRKEAEWLEWAPHVVGE